MNRKIVQIDFGIYINADDIAKKLRKGKITFKQYKVKVEEHEFLKIVSESGLLNKKFSLTDFKKSYSLKDNQLFLLNKKADERIAQIIADFLRKKLLSENKKFSFETVFSHSSKCDEIDSTIVPRWFRKYYLKKVN